MAIHRHHDLILFSIIELQYSDPSLPSNRVPSDKKRALFFYMLLYELKCVDIFRIQSERRANNWNKKSVLEEMNSIIYEYRVE